MTRRALVIGGYADKLQGIDRDVATMSAILERYGFELTSCRGETATRRQVLAGIERLIRDSQPGDAAVIYYSGHGGQVTNHQRSASQPEWLRPRYYQFLVPSDWKESELGDFRGILDIELARRLARLSAQTRNVAVILDCCHAEGTVRKSRSGATLINEKTQKYNKWIERHLEDIGEPHGVPVLDPESNAHVIKLAASTAEQTSREDRDKSGQHMGVMTRELCHALEECLDRSATWDEVYHRVAARVRARPGATQEPQIDGPAHRRLFELDERPAQGALPLFYHHDQAYLGGGSLVGVTEGAQYAVMPIGSDRADRERATALATVTDVEPDRARVTLPSREAAAGKPRLRSSRPQISPLAGLRAFAMAEHEPGRNANILRSLQSGTGRHELRTAFACTWGYVRGGEPELVSCLSASAGRPTPVLTTGERIYFELCSPDPKSSFTFWSVLDIDVDGSVRLRTRSARTGIAVAGYESYFLGARPGDRLHGLPIVWPRNAPPHIDNLRSFIIIITSKPVDLRALETVKPPRHDLDSPKLFDAATPDRAPAMRSSEPLGYAVARLDVRVEPPA